MSFNNTVPNKTHNAQDDLLAILANFLAIRENEKSNDPPANPQAGMDWHSGSSPSGGYIANSRYVRNNANNAWIKVYSETDLPILLSTLQSISSIYAEDAGSTDTYIITLSPVPASWAALKIIIFKANTINTGACTLNPNGLGARTIKKNFNQDLTDGDIKAGQIVIVVNDGTNLQLIGGSSSSGANFAVGDIPVAASTGIVGETSTSYTKVKEIYIPRAGNLRVKFDMRLSGTSTSKARIYKNGSAVGTERSTSSTSYTTYSEDITGLAAGDRLQIYVDTGASGITTYIRNFILYASATEGFVETWSFAD